MSVIIAAYSPEGKVVVAADNRVCTGQQYKGNSGRSVNPKLYRREDGLIFGGVGYLSDTQALYYNPRFLPHEELEHISIGYLVNQHIDIVNNLIDFHGQKPAVGGNEQGRLDADYCQNSFLIVYNGKAFDVAPDGAVIQLEPPASIVGNIDDDEVDDEEGHIVKPHGNGNHSQSHDNGSPADFLVIGSGAEGVATYLTANLSKCKTIADTRKVLTDAIKATSANTWTIDDHVTIYTSEPIFTVHIPLHEVLEEQQLIDEASARKPKSRPRVGVRPGKKEGK